MPSATATRLRNDRARQRLHAEAAAFCARFGIERAAEVHGVALRDAEGNQATDRELLADVLAALNAMLDGGDGDGATRAANRDQHGGHER